MGWRKSSTSEKINRDPSKEELETAHALCFEYRQRLRLRSPFSTKLLVGDPEESRFWPHFLAAALVVLELEADPKAYIASQFDRLAFKKAAFPFPSQLSTEFAVLAWVRYSEKYKRKAEKVIRSTVVMEAPDEREERKLKSWASRLGLPVKRVLRDHPGEFSEGMHRQHGVWDDVRAALMQSDE